MLKKSYHPNAFLSRIKNFKSGLFARTQILNILENSPSRSKNICKKTKTAYGAVIHHIKLLEAEGIIERKGKKPYEWKITGLGQKRL